MRPVLEGGCGIAPAIDTVPALGYRASEIKFVIDNTNVFGHAPTGRGTISLFAANFYPIEGGARQRGQPGEQLSAWRDSMSPQSACRSPTCVFVALALLLPLGVRAAARTPGSTLTAILIVGGMVAALYFGREVLVPIALALLLSFVLAPLVRRLQSWRFPRIIAVAIVAIFAFAIIFGLGAFMVSQVSQLANDLPRYESNLTDKIQSLQGVAAGTGPLERASDVLKDLKREIEKPGNVSPAEPSLGGQAQPRACSARAESAGFSRRSG